MQAAVSRPHEAAQNKARTAKIITVFNEKGGAGKTTTSCQLAGTLGRMGYQVLVADLDPQQTAADWMAAAGGANFKATLWSGYRYGAAVTSEIQKLIDKFDVIVADCAPSVLQPTTSAMLVVSDLVLIPTLLSPPDLTALQSAKRLFHKAVEQIGVPVPVRVIPNRVRANVSDTKEALEYLRSDPEFPVTKAVLGDRIAYARSMTAGATVHDLRGGEEAGKEVDILAAEVIRLCGLPKIHSK